MIRMKTKGNYNKTIDFLEQSVEGISLAELEKYGVEGVNALKAATPVDSGETANSWYYEIYKKRGSFTISFRNTNIVNNVPIAIILQYGHGTRNGGWVRGTDYINPAIQPIFDKLAEAAWKEVIK